MGDQPQRVHPAQQQLLAFFAYEHLPAALREVSKPFAALAHELVAELGATSHGGELTTALRKLLEAKDCAVRAALGVG